MSLSVFFESQLLTVDKMNLNLIEIVASNDFLGRLFGISVRAKAYRQVNFRIYVLLFLLWLDLAFALATAFVPTENMSLLLQLGDLPFHVMNQNRYFMTGKRTLPSKGLRRSFIHWQVWSSSTESTRRPC